MLRQSSRSSRPVDDPPRAIPEKDAAPETAGSAVALLDLFNAVRDAAKLDAERLAKELVPPQRTAGPIR